MDAVRIDTQSTNSLLSSKILETSDISIEKDKEFFCTDDFDEDIQLRFSDDEEVEQDTSDCSDNHQTNLQLKDNDKELDALKAIDFKETPKVKQEDLSHKQNLLDKENLSLVGKDLKLKNKNFLEKPSDEICSVEEESIMSGERIPPLMHNSPKYWNFNKGWKGVNSSRNYSHRGGNDWYKQSYSEKDKTHYSKTHYHNQNKFRLQNTPRSMFQSGPLEGKDKGTKKDELSKLKNNLTSADSSSEKKQNGISNGLRSEGNSSSVQRNKSIEEAKNSLKEIKIVKISSEHKENFSVVDKLSSEKSRENDKAGCDILKNKEDKSGKDLAHTRSYNGVSSTSNDCDVSMIEIVERKSNTPSNKGKSGRINRIEKEIRIDDDDDDEEDCIITEVGIVSSKNSVNNEVNNEMQIKIVEVGSSQDDIIEQDKIETLMEVDDSNESTCKIIDDEPVISIVEGSVSNNIESEIEEVTEEATEEVSEEVNEINKEVNEEASEELIEKVSEDTNVNSTETICENVNEKSDEVDTSEVQPPIDQTEEYNNEKSNENGITEDNALSTVTSEMNVSQDEPSQDETAVVSTTDETTENMDNRSETRSPQPLVIAEADDINTTDLKSADTNETSPTSSKEFEKDCAEQTEEALQTDADKEVSDKEDRSEEEKGQEDASEGIESNDEEQEKDDIPTDEIDVGEEEIEAPLKESETDIAKAKPDSLDSASTSSNDTSQTVPTSGIEEDKIEENNEKDSAVVQKKRRRKRDVALSEILSEENGVRQKRRSARNAEEMIRKELNGDLDETEDEEELSSEYNKPAAAPQQQTAQQPDTIRPPTLKRTLDDVDSAAPAGTSPKRSKHDEQQEQPTSAGSEKQDIVPKCKESSAEMREAVRKISQQDIRGKLKKLTKEEMEALLLQKIVESVTIRGEMGKLREQNRASKRNQEAMRTKIQQLQKQVEGFEMVLKRLSYDKNANSDKFVTPIKINRSVGLQVNFVSDQGIQNLKQVQAIKACRGVLTPPQTQDHNRSSLSPKKLMKTRSPRRPDLLPASQTGPAVVNGMTTLAGTSPATLVTSKVLEASNATKRPITLQNANNIVQILPPGQTQVQQAQQAILVNAATARPGRASDLIDLTDEEDKSKPPVTGQIATTVANRQLPRTVYQAVTTSGVTLNTANLRLFPANGQTTPTAIVNNINNPKIAYVMQNTSNPRQIVLANGSQIRQVTNVQGKNIPTIYSKQGVPTLANGQTVRVLQSTAANLQMIRAQHPAPLPDTPNTTPLNISPKLVPPAPSLKITKVPNGIVLSWNMTVNDKYANIASYQLYAYQEVAGTAPSPSLWKKVGDVRALPLPMACTLTQFTAGNNYYFAVRAVDEFSRFGVYSKPGNISL